MDFDKAKLVIQTLASHGKKGCGIITLASETQIPQSELRELLDSHKDFFCQLNSQSAYTINLFSHYKGSTEEMIKELSQQESNRREYKYYAYIVIAFIVGFLIGGIS